MLTIQLYIAAIGIELATAKMAIERMAGEYRIPNLLKLVDKLSKSQDRIEAND